MMARFARVASLVAAIALVSGPMIACRDPETAKQRHLEKGNTLAAAGNHREAMLEYRNALKRDARFGEARVGLADALAATNQPADAAREYLRAAELLPERVDLQVRAGAILLSGREFERAQQHARAALAIDARNVDAHIVLATALAGLKDPESALAELQEAIQLAPEDARPYTSIGAVQASEGNREAAEAAFRKAVEIAPQSLPARTALAYYYWSIQRLTEAEDTLQAASALDRNDVMVNRMLAAFYLSTNRASEAEAPLLRLSNANDVSATLTLADLYVAMGRRDSARPLFEALKNETQTRTAAVGRLASLDYADDRKEDAHRAIDELLEEQPNATPLLITKARWYSAERRLDDALQMATRAVASAPTSAASHYALGLAHGARGEADEATKAFTETLRLNPRAAAAELQLSRLMLVRGDADKALSFAVSARKSEPGSLDARLGVATALLAKRDLVKVDAELRSLRADYPQSSAVHALYGRLLAARADTPGAMRALDHALELNPNNIEALAARLALDLQTKRVEEGRARLTQAISGNPESSALLVIAARFETTAGDRAAAERYLRESIDADPANLDAYGLLAGLYLRQNRLDEARAEYERLAARRPETVGYKTMVGMILDVQQRTDEAIKVYEDIVKATSGAAVAANNLAYHYATRGGSLDVALQLAQRAKQQLPDNPDVNDTLGWIYYKKNLPSLAIPPLELSVAKNPAKALYQFHLGLAYAQAGRTEEARRALEQALELQPDFAGADEARAALASLKG